MIEESFVDNLPNWQQQVEQFLIQGDYSKAAILYEQAIEAEPDIKLYYWQLGLLLLLQGKEVEAQTTWLLAMAEGEQEQVDEWITELVEILQTEIERREKLADYKVAWAIRQHLREISPNDINNRLHIIQLSIQLDKFTGEDLTTLGIIPLLQSKAERASQDWSPHHPNNQQLPELSVEVDRSLLLKTLYKVLNYAPLDPSLLEFAEACLPYVQQPEDFINILMPSCIKIAYTLNRYKLAAKLAELCLRLDANHIEVSLHLAAFYQYDGQYDRGIKLVKRCYSLVQGLPAQLYTNHLTLRGLMSAGGYWQDALDHLKKQESLLLSLFEAQPNSLDRSATLRLLTSSFFFPYFRDDPKGNRAIHNQVAQICQSNFQLNAKEQVERYCQRVSHIQASHSTKPLKIGYISHCLRRHSVGWLARGLFEHHNSERFKIYTYFVNYLLTDDPIQAWYVNQADKAYPFSMEGWEIAEQIAQDEVDILIDLDSITLDITCEVVALKPAPVQATWLGWDASGLPAIDYFIADPYVLPDSAQDYYSEKIWRLPQTYIAVDGFEVAVPTLRREQVDIPSDAVVYLSAQSGYKRHLDITRLQMNIIKEVPNSYFLIKGSAEEESIKNFFIQIAEEEGLSCNRLRFLPDVALEVTHRANLSIADVVLDTYPYNGATTTLETLWMGIPLVTRVGEQFAARNSYTMMMNVGVTEGIAWTDEEYIEWGVRLGKDETLRQQISWKLRQSKQTSPLWNGKQFTREMEKAYEQMWAKYLENNNS